MRILKVNLAGEEIELSPTYGNIEKVERTKGLFSFCNDLQSGVAKVTDVVNIYYYMQNNTAYSQGQIADKIMSDGLNKHLLQVVSVLSSILNGNGQEVSEEEIEKKPVGE